MTLSPRSRWIAVCVLVLTGIVLSACDSDPSTEETAMYCELIDPQTVKPIVGAGPVKDFGGPVPASPNRMFNCDVNAAEDRDRSIAVFVSELGSEDERQQERTAAARTMTKVAEQHPEHYRTVEEDDVVGYAWFDGEGAAANVVTVSRRISVTAPAGADQAAEFTPLLLQVARELDANLDVWDAEHPAGG